MDKIYIVRVGCSNCPSRRKRLIDPDGSLRKNYCIETGKDIDCALTEFPEWCPLEDIGWRPDE